MLLYMDGFDWAGLVADIDGRWARGSTSTAHINISTNLGRNSGGCLLALGTSVSWIERLLAAAKTTLFMQCAWNPASNTVNGHTAIFTLLNPAGTVILTLSVRNATDQLTLWRGFIGGTQLATGPTVLAGTTYYLIEMKAVIDSVSGAVTVKVNGVDEIVFAGNTEGAASGCIRVRLGGGTATVGAGMQRWDDVVVFDDLGGVNDDFLGNVAVQYFVPDADTAEKDFAPSAGAVNFEMVDDAAPDGDTSYVESMSVGDKDRYGVTPGIGTGAILGIAVHSVEKGGGDVRHVVFHGATEAQGAAATTNASTYQSRATVFELNPDTSALFTAAELDTLEIGIEAL